MTCIECQRKRAKVSFARTDLRNSARRAAAHPTARRVEDVRRRKAELAKANESLVQHEAECQVAA